MLDGGAGKAFLRSACVRFQSYLIGSSALVSAPVPWSIRVLYALTPAVYYVNITSISPLRSVAHEQMGAGKLTPRICTLHFTRRHHAADTSAEALWTDCCLAPHLSEHSLMIFRAGFTYFPSFSAVLISSVRPCLCASDLLNFAVLRFTQIKKAP